MATRVTLGLGMFVGACGLVALTAARRSSPGATGSPPVVAPCPAEIARPVPALTSPVPISPAPTPPPTPGPPAAAFTITADPDADAQELAEVMRSWLDDTGVMPNIQPWRGVTFARGSEMFEEDCGYMHTRRREATHTCGSPARWLRDALHAALADQRIHCASRTCTYDSANQFSPAGTIQFRLDDGVWTLLAWTELYPNDNYARFTRDNAQWAVRTVRALSTARCAGMEGEFD